MVKHMEASLGLKELADIRFRLEDMADGRDCSRSISQALRSTVQQLNSLVEKIEHGEREWQDAFDAVQDPIFIHDNQFRVIRANQAYARLAEKDIREVIGLPYWKAFPRGSGPFPQCCKLLETDNLSQHEEVRLENGQRYLSRGFAVRDADGKFLYAVHIMQDISEKHRLQTALEESANRYRAMFQGAPDAIFVSDAETGQLIDANPAAERLIGRNRGEILGMHQLQLHPDDCDALRVFQEYVQESGEEEGCPPVTETELLRADGRRIPVEVSAHAYLLDGRKVLQGVFRDISARKQAEEQLKETDKNLKLSLNLLSGIIESIPLRVFWKDREFRFLGCNSQFARDAGYSCPDELLHKTDFDMKWAEQAEQYRLDDRQVLEKGESKLGFEEQQTTPEGKRIWLRTSKVPLRGENEEAIGVLGIYDDVTAQKEAQQELQLSESRLKESQFVARLGSWELDLVNNELWWSDENYRIFGQAPGGANTYETFLNIVHPEDRDRVNHAFTQSVKNRSPYDIEHRLLLSDGRVKWVHERSKTYFAEDGTPLRSSGTTLDITEQRRIRDALNRSNRALKAIGSCNSVLVRAQDETELLDEMCRVIIEDGGYRFAWIGYVEDDADKYVRPVAHAGFEQGYLQAIKVKYDDSELGQGPVGTAIRNARPCVIPDTLNDTRFLPWREAAIARDYHSVLALPLKRENGEVFAVICIYAEDVGAFDEEACLLMREMASDIAYGILALRTRSERDHYLEAHRKSDERYKQALVETIRAVAMTVEKRDPYTAGHQYRVAQLSVAIGRELGMDEDRLEGLRLGAMIHDIGKIYVPAEILNRPGRLSKAEFEIIKSHSEVGFDIIKDVKFPWPVADMVIQHHERMDGSGYPQGLQGEEIILEARILSVADVVEAITAHRPYRPAVGLEQGLAEIENNRGTRYDPQVVDACLSLIREGRFAFGEQGAR